MKGHTQNPFIITIVGAESSGKTTLAAYLAECLGSRWIPEFAREYLERLDRGYVFEDLEKIAKGTLLSYQVEPGMSLEAIPIRLSDVPKDQTDSLDGLVAWLNGMKREYLIVDGGLLTVKMWAQIKYNKQIEFVEEELKKDLTSLYVLCRPGKTWVSDPQREAPLVLDRVWIFNQYLRQLVSMDVPYFMINRVE